MSEQDFEKALKEFGAHIEYLHEMVNSQGKSIQALFEQIINLQRRILELEGVPLHA